MVTQPHYDSYSIAARICLAISMAGGTLFAVTAIVSWYFLH